MYAEELKKTLTPAELDKFRDELLTGTKAVASASGGLLGIGFSVSPNEQRVLDKVASTLKHA